MTKNEPMNMELTNIELAVLGLIAENPMYGYQVEQIVAERGMREWTDIGFSSIYYLLNKMEKSAWLESDKVDAGDRPARKVYRITEQGRNVLIPAVLARLRSPRLRSGDFDLALANLWVVPPEAARSAMQAYAFYLRSRYDYVYSKWERDGKENLPFHVRAVFDHSLALIHWELEWVEKWTQAYINEMEKA